MRLAFGLLITVGFIVFILWAAKRLHKHLFSWEEWE